MATPTTLSETTTSVQRMQSFDVQKLARTEELGSNLDFKTALEPVQNIIDIYQRLSITILPEFPDNILQQIKNQADADYSRIKQILDFSPAQANPVDTRNTYINQIKDGYTATFNALWHPIAYGVSRITDSQRLENEARGILQGIVDKADTITTELEENRDAAKNVLDEVRKVAAEQGVSQQAIYFRDEAQLHKDSAEIWRATTLNAAKLVGGFAALSLIMAYLPWLQPENNFQAIQMVTGKLLLFGVLAYLLVMAAKNFLAHKHNEVINRHRQNALVTFNALVEAAGSDRTKDIVLINAATCIFSPQETGYSKGGNDGQTSSGKSVVEILPSVVSSINKNE